MIKGTTPTLVLKLKDRDITDAVDYLVTIKSGTRKLHKKKAECETYADDGNTYIIMTLSQSETLFLKAGGVDIQMNWQYSNGAREASNKASIELSGNLFEGRMTL